MLVLLWLECTQCSGSSPRLMSWWQDPGLNVPRSASDERIKLCGHLLLEAVRWLITVILSDHRPAPVSSADQGHGNEAAPLSSHQQSYQVTYSISRHLLPKIAIPNDRLKKI